MRAIALSADMFDGRVVAFAASIIDTSDPVVPYNKKTVYHALCVDNAYMVDRALGQKYQSTAMRWFCQADDPRSGWCRDLMSCVRFGVSQVDDIHGYPGHVGFSKAIAEQFLAFLIMTRSQGLPFVVWDRRELVALRNSVVPDYMEEMIFGGGYIKMANHAIGVREQEIGSCSLSDLAGDTDPCRYVDLNGDTHIVERVLGEGAKLGLALKQMTQPYPVGWKTQ